MLRTRIDVSKKLGDDPSCRTQSALLNLDWVGFHSSKKIETLRKRFEDAIPNHSNYLFALFPTLKVSAVMGPLSEALVMLGAKALAIQASTASPDPGC